MNKIKKFFASLGLAITGFISRVSAVSSTAQTKYGVFDPRMIEEKYGVFEPIPSIGERISGLGKLAIPIVLFTIGLFVVLGKKITKKLKATVVVALIISAIIGYLFMNYIATNF